MERKIDTTEWRKVLILAIECVSGLFIQLEFTLGLGVKKINLEISSFSAFSQEKMHQKPFFHFRK